MNSSKAKANANASARFVDSLSPVNRFDPVEPVDPVDPGTSADPVAPGAPDDSVDPVDPVDRYVSVGDDISPDSELVQSFLDEATEKLPDLMSQLKANAIDLSEVKAEGTRLKEETTKGAALFEKTEACRATIEANAPSYADLELLGFNPENLDLRAGATTDEVEASALGLICDYLTSKPRRLAMVQNLGLNLNWKCEQALDDTASTYKELCKEYSGLNPQLQSLSRELTEVRSAVANVQIAQGEFQSTGPQLKVIEKSVTHLETLSESAKSLKRDLFNALSKKHSYKEAAQKL